MKKLPKMTIRQTQPNYPGNAVNSPAHPQLRTGKYLPGALLLLALIGVVSYGSTSQQSASNNSPAAKTQLNNKVTPTANSQANAGSTNQEEPIMQSNQNDHRSISTRIVNNNGQTTVTVDGQPIVTPEDGSVSKTIITDSGNTVQVKVTQGDTNNRNFSVNTFTSSDSSDITDTDHPI